MCPEAPVAYSSPRLRAAAFTLVELLVVIAIVALLISIILPALRHARESAAKTRELAAAAQLMLSYHQYASDNRDVLLPGLLPEDLIDTHIPRQRGALHVTDRTGAPLHFSTACRYPWRLAPYVSEHDFRGMYVDKALYDQYAAKADRPSVADGSSSQYAFSNNPTFGINSVYVGGDAGHKFGWLGRLPYIQRSDQVLFTASLLVFASARGNDADSPTAVIGGGGTTPIRVVRGWYVVTPPKVPHGTLPYDDPGFRWSETTAPYQFGNLHLRHGAKAVTAMFDGHVEMLGVTAGDRAGLRDMRRWSNWAGSPEWQWVSQ